MNTDDDGPAGGSDLDRLLRWERSGGTWTVAGRSRDAVTLALMTCDGAEEMDVLTSSDPEVLAHVLARPDARSR
jgi:hypothetical protein